MGLGTSYGAMPLKNRLTLRRYMQGHGLEEEAPPSSTGSDFLNHSHQAFCFLAGWLCDLWQEKEQEGGT